jgi:uncharacterized iron-regulated membrane protein
MRSALLVVHRWFGLATAGFLFVAGLTGALISWDHELDAALNPRFYAAPAAPGVDAAGALRLARELEAAEPALRVTYLPLGAGPGEALQFSVAARSGDPAELGYNQVALDPASGAVQARREWGAVSLARENLLPFLYRLHYSLHIPDVGALELGVLVMGVVGILWTLDAFAALAVSFPRRAAWRKSFAFRWRRGGFPLLFDLHRSGGVWLWTLLLVLALTSVSMNLQYEVVRPLIARLSTLTPDPFALRPPVPATAAPEPRASREQVLVVARQGALSRGWRAPAGAVFYSPEYALYGVGFFESGHDHGDVGLGNPWLYFDAATGAPAGASVPGEGSAGDIYLQAQFPLHSGRIAGLGGRILVSALGLAVATLSVTGVYVWWRKRPRGELAPRSPHRCA